MQRGALLAVSITLAACQGAVTQGPDDIPSSATWSLIADSSGAFIDPRRPELGGYPNPLGEAWMEVFLSSDGTICATTPHREACGGPAQGIPYVLRTRMEADHRTCFSASDLFGHKVSEVCGPKPGHAMPGSVGTSEFITPGTGPVPPLPAIPPGPVPGTASSPGSACDDPVAVGVDLFVAHFNEGLRRAGIEGVLDRHAAAMLVTFEDDDVEIDAGCDDILEHLDDEYSDDHDGTDDFVFGPDAIDECRDGSCRIGQLVTRAMASACAAIPDDCRASAASAGIAGAGGGAIRTVCPGDDQGDEFASITDCVGSPLVLDLDGDGLDLVGPSDGPRFPLLMGVPVRTGWVRGDDALLALDVDGNGAIEGGAELFGEGSMPGRDGFAALAAHDADHSGSIDAQDPVFARLLVWRDDGDGRSTQPELTSLTSIGIRAIPVAARDERERDAHGNELGARVDAWKEDGSTLRVTDVWFAFRND